MASKNTAKNGNGKKRTSDALLTEEKVSIWSQMNPATVRGIAGVSLFVVAILLTLSALGLAGMAGDKVYAGIWWVVGVGYYMLPIMLIGWALALFNRSYAENKLRPIRMTGAILFFVAALAIVGVVSRERAGELGNLVARPMVAYLDTIATLVILAGILIISLLLLLDSELWILMFEKVRGLFRQEPSDEDVPLVVTTGEGIETDAPAVPVPAADEPTAEPQTIDTRTHEVPLPPEDRTASASTPRDKAVRSREPTLYELPSEYTPPPLSLLESDRGKPNVGDTKARANLIRRTLQHFRIPVEMDEIVVGPTVTRYSLKPAEGVKLSKIVALQSNLELALAASPIRIEAPIPGKSLVGIEVPNTGKAIVGLAGLLSSPEFTEETVPLFVTLGKDITGMAHYANIGKMPHLLVAGTTGSGKSVMIHTLVTSLLYRNGPERLKFIMVDPKRVELTLYDNIPHLLTPVITDAKKCILALKWATKEMERRYDILQRHKVQDIGSYHTEVVAPALTAYEKSKAKGAVDEAEVPDLMAHIVVIIDELADIMSAYPRELEAVIVRLAQMSRAVGIHLILSTQRPEAKVITGLIKANIPTRIALKVNTLIDSRVVLDQGGAEKLLGYGDMLYLSGDMAKPRRIQTPFLTTNEVKKITAFLIKHNNYTLGMPIDFSGGDGNGDPAPRAGTAISFDELEKNDDRDDIYGEVRSFVLDTGKASTSLIQRRFKVGYGRAARIMDYLEEDGVIAGSDGTNRPRDVIGSSSANEPASPSYDRSEEQENV